MSAKRALLICIEALAVIVVIGCAPATMSNNTASSYHAGTLFTSSDRDFDTIYQASQRAMEKLEFKITNKTKDILYAHVDAKRADGTDIAIGIRPTADKRTEYKIHVGTFGDETQSRKILAEIEKALAAGKK
jgi:uncharacterized lipoprotein